MDIVLGPKLRNTNIKASSKQSKGDQQMAKSRKAEIKRKE